MIIGGTGMLRRVSLYLAGTGDVVTVVARSREALRTLAEEAHRQGGVINPVAVDYGDSPLFQDALNCAVRDHGRVERVVTWIHASAKEAPAIVARAVGRCRFACRYFELCGSGAHDPSETAERRRAEMKRVGNIVYRQIILGFIREPGGSRWLSNDEIAEGVIEALESDNPRQVVGVLHPWSDRPNSSC